MEGGGARHQELPSASFTPSQPFPFLSMKCELYFAQDSYCCLNGLNGLCSDINLSAAFKFSLRTGWPPCCKAGRFLQSWVSKMDPFVPTFLFLELDLNWKKEQYLHGHTFWDSGPWTGSDFLFLLPFQPYGKIWLSWGSPRKCPKYFQ